MSTQDGYVYYTRRFLNHPGFHGTAAVLAFVRDAPDNHGQIAGLEITDCFRTVCFELPVDTPERRANTLAKLSDLHATVRELTEALTEAT